MSSQDAGSRSSQVQSSTCRSRKQLMLIVLASTCMARDSKIHKFGCIPIRPLASGNLQKELWHMPRRGCINSRRFGSPSRMAATILSEALAMSTRPKPFCLWAVADMPCPWPPKPRTRQPDHSQRNEVKSPPGLFQFFSQFFFPQFLQTTVY